MSTRPEDDDDGREPTLIDPAAETQRLAIPEGAGRGRPPGEDVVVGSRYEVRELLGSGGMCDVWRAHDPVLEREVAVKQLLPRWRDEPTVRERFAAEALRVAKLSHPAIVGVLDAGEDAAGPFLVMELIDGPSLEQRLAADDRLEPDEVIAIGRAVARGLGAAHRAEIVHRDVKPGNILLDPRHGARLTDFGIAKATAEMDLTATGEILGTAAYLAPEQAMGQPVDARSDIYALGCVLFECLTGQRPFSGDTPVQVASARIGAQVHASDRVAGIPAALDAVVSRAMAPDPEARWPDGDAMATALAQAGHHPVDPTVPTGPRPGIAGSRRPRPATPPEGMQTTQRLPAGGGDAPVDEASIATAALPRDPAHPGAAGSQVAASPADPHAADPYQADPADEGWDQQPTPAPARTGDRRRAGTLVTIGLAAAGLVIATVLALGADDDGTPAAAEGEPSAEGSDAAPAEAGAPLTGLAVASFDPQGDGAENEDSVGLLTDGDPTTAWATDGYNTAAFGNLKSGVGVLVDLGSEVTVAEVRLLGMPIGQSIELRTAVDAPSAIEGTEPVVSVVGVGTETALRPDAPFASRYLLVWLVPDLPADGGRFRGSIGELQVLPG